MLNYYYLCYIFRHIPYRSHSHFSCSIIVIIIDIVICVKFTAHLHNMWSVDVKV